LNLIERCKYTYSYWKWHKLRHMISDKQTKGQKSNELSGLSGYKNTHTLGPSMSSSGFSIHKNMCVSLSSQTRPQSCTVSKLSVSRVSARSNLSLFSLSLSLYLIFLLPHGFSFFSLSFFWHCQFPIWLFPLYNLFQLCRFYWLGKDHIKSQMEGNIFGLH